jgi:hypothetical protein
LRGPAKQAHDREEPNRAGRRPQATEWRRGIRQLQREGGDVWSAEIIGVDNFSIGSVSGVGGYRGYKILYRTLFETKSVE